MGGILSVSRGSRGHRSSGQAPTSQGLYRYSPSNANPYFSSHYYLGHRKFETGEPEVFLFGDLQDLNYLPPKPVKFPYKQPPKSQPLKTLRSFINVQRDSIKLIKIDGSSSQEFCLSFTFDSDLPCQFTIFTSIPDNEEVDSLRKRRDLSAVLKYGSGCEQQFKEVGHVINPSELLREGYDPSKDLTTIPLAILMETDSQEGPGAQQAQLSLCTLDNFGEDNFSIKIIKQKLLAGGMELLLQELYGLENKLKPKEEGEVKKEDEDSESEAEEDLGAECVICITDIRDTLLLPCRHLCLCSSCAANLRYQASNCPICRAPFRALLHIRALEPLPSEFSEDDDTMTGDPKYAVPGFKCVPLLQALNGYQLEEEEEEKLQNGGQTGHQVNNDLATSPPHTSSVVTTEFCVIHIEDGPAAEEVTSAPVESPVRTLVKPECLGNGSLDPSGEKSQLGNPESISLPGTPDIDHTPRTPDTIPTPKGHHSDFPSDTQTSYCGSSISSEVSVKSTDALITMEN